MNMTIFVPKMEYFEVVTLFFNRSFSSTFLKKVISF